MCCSYVAGSILKFSRIGVGALLVIIFNWWFFLKKIMRKIGT
jgi:hypothetical protein